MISWVTLGDSVVGTAHIARSQPCQDGFRFLVHTDGSLSIAVADGAGSATHSSLGAETVCNLLIQHRDWISDEAIRTESGLRQLMKLAHGAVGFQAAKLNVSNRELACTALFAHISANGASFVQLGDGAIVISSDSAYRVIFWPEPGEYANMTDFLSDEKYESRLQFQFINEPIHEIALFTDGLQRLALDFTQKIPHPGFFRPLFQKLLAASDIETLYEPFRSFLDSSAINARTDDDKTLVLAVRKS